MRLASRLITLTWAAALAAPLGLPAVASTDQDYLGAPLAVAGGKVFMASNDNLSGRSLVYATGLPG
jgi:hypothetical protein